MMINLVKLTSALVLKVKSGVDANGNDLFKNISLKKVKTTAAEQDLFDVAQGKGALLSTPVEGIFRQNLDEMISQ
jgi:hypothetical protein